MSQHPFYPPPPPGWRPQTGPQMQEQRQSQHPMQHYAQPCSYPQAHSSYPPAPYSQHPQQPYPSYPPQAYAYPQQQQQQPYVKDGLGLVAVPAQMHARGTNLVFWSRMILLAACLLSFGGCGAMIGGPEGGRAFFGIGLLVGVSLFVVAAIVGTIGRRFQGRFI